MVIELLKRIAPKSDNSGEESARASPPDRSPPSGAPDPLDELVASKPQQFATLLEANGGRMKQSDIVAETEWSSATVSRVLSEMESNGVIRKISIGRENVIALVGAEPAGYDPPAVPADQPGGDGRADAPDGEPAILLVEDSSADARLLREAFREADISNPIHVVPDGSDALEFLLQRGPYADAPRPCLVLLDLALLMIDGLDVLRELDERETLQGVPLLVLSRSSSSDDVRKAYDNGATAYLTKPDSFEELVELADAIDEFWLAQVVSPEPEPAPLAP